eukprot:TRINITY_DN2718_c0_g1::TRINITY_DN2718_c0_g1_i1::g.27567::m.27567 TRINITY_DN2718_c0_g1::TRINITY_DN2718_c0_g1_i1::g.27567  ORF type:complete len:416 (-),score=154.78,sp/Q0JHZ2/C3H11_ORYSJ/46.93/7e-83,zf-CCCH/PF00642.19/1.5e-05,zf-CCCH/PF00642.19/1.3e+03,zf-CCCH/PF00642.19/1.1e+03,zf-CCCH_2/PF14608.1/1.4,zf-CCCH_2/PF14608.1/74 TRINITY_DN2718_c0_g1_i1:670-1848(-)
MPPKKDNGQKKAEMKKKEKAVEDKTFGLKNKNKSKKVAAFIKTVTSAAQGTDKERLKEKARQDALKAEKEAEKQRQKEVASLFKTAPQKVEAGVDPKSVICQFFKQGLCVKGSKCKFSHDVTVERRSAKIDLYTDQRDVSNPDEQTSANPDLAGMDAWDQKTLEQAVKTKQFENQSTTTIVCKHFLEAIEKKQYGWFWTCPNGGKACKYRHALPPGYVLKSSKKVEDEEEDDNPFALEESIEAARKLITTHTPVTLESFKAWKEEKKKEKDRMKDENMQSKMANLSAEDKKRGVGLSGRELFTFNPDAFAQDDDEAADEDLYAHREDDNEEDEPGNSGEGFRGSDDDGGSAEGDDDDDGSGSGSGDGDDDNLAEAVDESLFMDDDDSDDDNE